MNLIYNLINFNSFIQFFLQITPEPDSAILDYIILYKSNKN